MLRWPIKATTTGTIDVTGIPAATTVRSRPFGRLRFIRFNNPAAGANLVLETSQVYPNKVWRVMAAGCLLTTDANVGNRFVSFALEPPGSDTGIPTRWASWASNRAMPANEAMEYFWGIGMHKDDLGTLIEHHQQGSLPDVYWATSDHRIIFFVADRQAGDQLSEASIMVDEWDIEPGMIG